MNQKLSQLKVDALKRIQEAESTGQLNGVRITYLGRNGEITTILKGIKDIPVSERPQFGKDANQVKKVVEQAIVARSAELSGEAIEKMTKTEWLDVSIPTPRDAFGHLHPLTIITRQMVDIFTSLGYEIADGPEVETDFYNFQALNIPPEHPARDMWDTFWVKNSSSKKGKEQDDVVLRTHISNMQVRYMRDHRAPFKVVMPGRVYRYEATDATHENTFSYIEGMMVGDTINLKHMIGTLTLVLEQLFERSIDIRLRPSYFPFVEPGFEIDMRCLFCQGKGCKSCGNTGWLEMLGAGMIHPKVFEFARYNPKKVTGFAFGMGIDRVAMMKFGIDDIRLLYSGDLRFSHQF
jgi:phenylalanyl-tRNA synthetase alpha chain